MILFPFLLPGRFLRQRQDNGLALNEDTVYRTSMCRTFCSFAVETLAGIAYSRECTCTQLHTHRRKNPPHIHSPRAVHKTEGFFVKSGKPPRAFRWKRHWHRPPALYSQVLRSRGWMVAFNISHFAWLLPVLIPLHAAWRNTAIEDGSVSLLLLVPAAKFKNLEMHERLEPSND